MSRGYPYRLPSKELVKPKAWVLLTDRGEEPLPPLLPTWDYGMDLSLRRTLEIDVGGLRDELGGSELGLAAGVFWSASRLRGAGSIEPIPGNGDRVRIELSADLRGWELGGTLNLHTAVYLVEEAPRRSGPVAWRAGSELWADRKSTKLQGDVPRFPVAVVDIAAQGYPAGAPWILDLQPDLHEPTLGALHLLINEEDEHVVEAVSAAEQADAEARALLSSIHYDAGRTLVDLAVGTEELEDEPEYPEESLGCTLQALLQRVFPEMSVSAVRDLRNTDPARYSGQIVAALRPAERSHD